MDAPKLRNSDWQAAFEEALPHLDRFQDKLNEISEDLRAVEKALTESGFRIETSVEILGSGDYLSWRDTGKNAWRICLDERISENERHWRPLIETPAGERWRVARSIPQLLREIAIVASRDPAPTESPSAVTDDDIPF